MLADRQLQVDAGRSALFRHLPVLKKQIAWREIGDYPTAVQQVLRQHLEALAAEQTKLLAELTRQRAGMADIPYMGEINAIMDQVT